MGFLFSKHKKPPLTAPIRIEPPKLPPPISVNQNLPVQFGMNRFLNEFDFMNPIEQSLKHIDFNINKFNRHQRILF